MTLITPDLGKQIQRALSAMQAPVRLVFFTNSGADEEACAYCAQTGQLLEEIAALDEKIRLEVFDLAKDGAVAESYQVDKVPAIALIRDTEPPVDYGIRLFGIPAGYEFTAFIEDILITSRGEHGLTPKTMEEVNKIDRPVHIQVYTTPT